MPKKHKVRFHRGDRRPAKNDTKLSYQVKMKKRGRKFVWQVIEQPTKNAVAEYFFEEDAQHTADFQNKHLVWQSSGGIPRFLWVSI